MYLARRQLTRCHDDFLSTLSKSASVRSSEFVDVPCHCLTDDNHPRPAADGQLRPTDGSKGERAADL